MTTRPYQGVTKGAGDTDSSWSLRVYVKRRFYGQGLQPNTELTVFVRISCLRLCKQYSNLCQAFKMELFAIIVYSINYDSQNSRPRKGTIYCSSLPLPPAQKYSKTLFLVSQLRSLPPISNCSVCDYQTVTRHPLLEMNI